MMKWGRKKPVSSSSSSSSTGLSRALPVSWFSKFNASSDSKPAKEKDKKKKDEETSKNASAKSSIKRRNDIQERRSNEVNAAATRKKSDEKFEEIMSSVRKKVRDFQIDMRSSFLEVDKGTVIMTPRIRDKQRCERRDQRLLEEKRKCSRRDASTVLGHPVTKQEHHQCQKLKETKLREVRVKADQQRKSLYIRRELNRIGTKENNSKVRVFSPRATEKCRVKAIEDLKKAAKAKAREDGDGGGRTENESFAVVKCSSDPQKDFRDSMIEMIMENGINHPEELKELLVCYLRLNTDEYHDMIIKVFLQVHNDLNFHYFGVE